VQSRFPSAAVQRHSKNLREHCNERFTYNAKQ
jgi:hypothetical protein